ncbi:hypothetical protein HanIR_Chr07g0326881 [Helianthus annuus]|nr:hypothetical protein HanIR_Chr07g0326881 [Helianthus annuus]
MGSFGGFGGSLETDVGDLYDLRVNRNMQDIERTSVATRSHKGKIMKISM